MDARNIEELCHSASRKKLIVDKFTLNQGGRKRQFSSFILFLSVIILVNLCPFNEPESDQSREKATSLKASNNYYLTNDIRSNLFYLNGCFEFIKVMFTNPVNYNKRALRSFQAEARVIGKMAKMWYIKKKIKKLSKKLKKHTIAVPVFTAIPIYEHSYYPQPHVTHVSHAGLHHAAASSYSPTIASLQLTPAASQAHPSSQQAQQMQASASSNHQQMAPSYRLPPAHHHHHPAVYHHGNSPAAHQIINSYAPSPPLYVDEAGGLYGHYGNAYGRYDGGYQLW